MNSNHGGSLHQNTRREEKRDAREFAIDKHAAIRLWNYFRLSALGKLYLMWLIPSSQTALLRLTPNLQPVEGAVKMSITLVASITSCISVPSVFYELVLIPPAYVCIERPPETVRMLG